MRAISVFLLLSAAFPVQAQDDRARTLADIRQELTVLSVEVQRLNRELVTTGGPGVAQPQGDLIRRVETIEAELSRLTAATEALEGRIARIVADGTNQVDDLRFRLCELTTDCALGSLPETAPLGGEVPAAGGAPVITPANPDAPQLAVGEQADFDAAKAALEAGDAAGAAERLARFADSYPGSPLGPEAALLRGQALEAMGDTTAAARAYLDSFSGTPNGPVAPAALLRLGLALDSLGQRSEACVTLGEVANRFPGSVETVEAQAARARLGCG
ncbi:MAG: tol-pal system protein YbgF [Rhodobacteraceae bacterium]|jgi:tol-pal system protein YbgF|nr:tol-pal system protein YbgF [Paracoccaceae bacterium]